MPYSVLYRPSAAGSVRCIHQLEEWHLVLSLLSAVSVTAEARPFAWAALSFLVDSNLVSDLNFSPARHLLLKFLFG